MVVRRRSPALQTHRQSEERMRTLIYRWQRRYYSDPQGVILIVLLLGGLGAVIFLGDMLAPVLASIVLAYLLEGLIRPLERRVLPRLSAVALVFSIFLASLL